MHSNTMSTMYGTIRYETSITPCKKQITGIGQKPELGFGWSRPGNQHRLELMKGNIRKVSHRLG